MVTDNFTLHPTLHADTSLVADLPLCRLLLMNDSRYPWLILVPRRMQSASGAAPKESQSALAYLRDLSDIPAADQAQFLTELLAVETALKKTTGAFKMNVGALGNMVQQLHVHVIARQQSDAAWPAPVWGQHPAITYQPSAAGQLIARIKSHLAPLLEV